MEVEEKDDVEVNFTEDDVMEDIDMGDVNVDMDEFIKFDDYWNEVDFDELESGLGCSYQEYRVKRHTEHSKEWDMDYIKTYGHHPSLDIQ